MRFVFDSGQPGRNQFWVSENASVHSFVFFLLYLQEFHVLRWKVIGRSDLGTLTASNASLGIVKKLFVSFWGHGPCKKAETIRLFDVNITDAFASLCFSSFRTSLQNLQLWLVIFVRSDFCKFFFHIVNHAQKCFSYRYTWAKFSWL